MACPSASVVLPVSSVPTREVRPRCQFHPPSLLLLPHFRSNRFRKLLGSNSSLPSCPSASQDEERGLSQVWKYGLRDNHCTFLSEAVQGPVERRTSHYDDHVGPSFGRPFLAPPAPRPRPNHAAPVSQPQRDHTRTCHDVAIIEAIRIRRRPPSFGRPSPNPSCLD